LIGNVLEWCADNTGGEFSYRGGGWNARLGSERVDYRLHVGKPDIRDHDLGFRVVCVVN
jgi:formylglycine-generating enzyme required for sulfatase activity